MSQRGRHFKSGLTFMEAIKEELRKSDKERGLNDKIRVIFATQLAEEDGAKALVEEAIRRAAKKMRTEAAWAAASRRGATFFALARGSGPGRLLPCFYITK